MTDEQKAAFINAQTALLQVEIKMMEAENLEREKQGLAHAHGAKQWEDLYTDYNHIIGYNACWQLFHP